MSTTNPEQEMYDAAVKYMVAEKSESDAWKTVAMVSHGITIDDFNALIKSVESRIKKDFGISRMPTKWRSAKSTVLAAMKASVSVVGKDGDIVPKTQLGKAVRGLASLASAAVPITAEEKALDLIHQLKGVLAFIPDSSPVATRINAELISMMLSPPVGKAMPMLMISEPELVAEIKEE